MRAWYAQAVSVPGTDDRAAAKAEDVDDPLAEGFLDAMSAAREARAGLDHAIPGVAPTRRRAAVGRDEVNAMTAGLGPQGDAVDARDLALLYLGIGAALRRSDLARLDLADLETTTQGLGVRVRRSKTDQEGRGEVRGIAAGEDGACPAVEAVELWRAQLARDGVTRGALWRPIHRVRSGRLTIRAARLSGHAINIIVTRRAARAGLDGDYGGHSLRRGFATEALAWGYRARGDAPGWLALGHRDARLRRRGRGVRAHQPHPDAAAAPPRGPRGELMPVRLLRRCPGAVGEPTEISAAGPGGSRGRRRGRGPWRRVCGTTGGRGF